MRPAACVGVLLTDRCRGAHSAVSTASIAATRFGPNCVSSVESLTRTVIVIHLRFGAAAAVAFSFLFTVFFILFFFLYIAD